AYTGSRSRRTRELARSYYGFCSKTEPFHYVMQDVNESFQMWYPTMLHRLVGWHHAKGHPVPRFLTLAQQSENSERKALFISEIPYWGDEREKRGIREYLTSSDPKCRSAAIQALAIIGDPDSEAELVANYTFQFPEAKRETLLAVAKINTGRQTEFFKQAYLQSSSQNTRAVALSCLFNYGPEGRKAFHELAHVGLDDSKFFEQIESAEAKSEGKELKMRV
ncbi:MAG: HEAT repeat domain-containing protein, partial [Paludibacteraceae bacterium]|nr:HEAT repeat domain-containing protein [Paludibacteraceae bacterium]